MVIATTEKLRELLEAAAEPCQHTPSCAHCAATGLLSKKAPDLARLVLTVAKALNHLQELSNLPADIPYYEMRDALLAARAALAAVETQQL